MSVAPKMFFDSNVLVYIIDDNNPEKQKVAIKVLSETLNSGNGCISTQSLQEFYNVATRKLKCPSEKAKVYLENFSQVFSVTKISVSSILKSIDISVRYKLSFWDSLIVISAVDSGSAFLVSEDLNSGQVIEGVKVINPFFETA